ncbi:sugar-binding domain-containing protein [Paenibacillus camerounensis]|uniref:sugar-binding domain-containing protein n=1 Tax=Paenibacillus camerounensis TaxID=1243663 RepID=UPI0005A78B67|nr:sugar-binding domain-containing protein [Paenibacillus camerounensis]
MLNIQQEKSVIDLAGQWAFTLDPYDKGEEEHWYRSALPEQSGTLKLPGTLSENGIGEQAAWGEEMNRESVRSLRQHYRFVGAAWYQCSLDIPQEWEDKHLSVFLERVMFKSALWINGQIAGDQDSLSVPHQFDVSGLIRTGCSNQITIRVDNRDIHKLGEFPSAYTDETQTIWNGLIGRLEIQARNPVYIADIQLYPDPENKSVRVCGNWVNTEAKEANSSLELFAFIKHGERPHQTEQQQYEFSVPAHCVQPFTIEYDMGEDMLLWDEFSPNVYEMVLRSRVIVEGKAVRGENKCSFGMRSFRSAGTQFEINGAKTFLRGTLECCIFPLTGYPVMDLDSWLRLFGIVKAYGLNHIRFHSWCPPEAAFAAADQIGIYVQAEGPVWMDTWNTPVGTHKEHYSYLPAEADRIIAAYGSHPSFCLFSNGNELNGDFDLLHQIVMNLKAADDRRVYTLTTNWDRPLDPADDLFCSQTVDGIGARGQYFPEELVNSTTLDYRMAVANRNVPLVTHEVGQYTVYPDVTEIDSYTGVLRPVNYEVIKADLERRGLLKDIGKFVRGSGMLALQLYREEIEAALRTPGLGGFQLLDLHDFPGQSTATVGILNAFWESKGLIEPEQFKQFCNATVLLLRMQKRIYAAGDLFEGTVEIAHFGPAELPESDILWRIKDDYGNVLDEGIVRTGIIPLGSGVVAGEFKSDCTCRVERSSSLKVSLHLADHDISNEWSIWVYPEVQAFDETESEIYITESLDETAERKLAAGENVLLTAGSNLRNAVAGKFYPVFWSPVHFASESPCGMFVNHNHPVFGSFPTKEYVEHQWKDLMDRSVSLCLDEDFAGNELIVQVIPNFYHNRRMSNLFECRVGAGRLIVCGFDIQNDLPARPAAVHLKRSIMTYMRNEAFQPADSFSIGQLRILLEEKNGTIGELKISGSELAIGKKAACSSSMNIEHAANKGNDGIGHTFWLAADDAVGHWWQVDLGAEREITGTRVKFHQEGNFLYVIQISSDGVNWRVAANQTGQTSEEQERVDLISGKARFVKINYNSLPPEGRAGHTAFEVYGY